MEWFSLMAATGAKPGQPAAPAFVAGAGTMMCDEIFE
jgi:hypothetical protein